MKVAEIPRSFIFNSPSHVAEDRPILKWVSHTNLQIILWCLIGSSHTSRECNSREGDLLHLRIMYLEWQGAQWIYKWMICLLGIETVLLKSASLYAKINSMYSFLLMVVCFFFFLLFIKLFLITHAKTWAYIIKSLFAISAYKYMWNRWQIWGP